MDKDHRLEKAWAEFQERQKHLDPEHRIERDDEPGLDAKEPLMEDGRKKTGREIEKEIANRYPPEMRDFEKRFQNHLEDLPSWKDGLDNLPAERRKSVIDKMRETYRQFEREEHQDQSTPGYDFYDPDTQGRYHSRVEFMLSTQERHISNAESPQQDKTQEAWDRQQKGVDHDQERERE